MLNQAQLELLNSFIAEEGIYFEIIRDDEAFNLGTKILYLERAINQDCRTFLRYLDKLYNPELAAEAKTANIEFIRALKLINDLCFNHDLKYGEFGTRKALVHYFGALGLVAPDEFKTTIQDIIKGRIAALQEGRIDESTAQKTTREASEPIIAIKTGWRKELDLPEEQLAQPMPHFLNGVLTVEQYQQLSEEVIDVITGNVVATQQLIQDCGLTWANIQALTAQEFRDLLPITAFIAQLHNIAHIPFADLLALDPAVRASLFRFRYPDTNNFIKLITEAHIPFTQLLALDESKRGKLFDDSDKVICLINQLNIPLARLLKLSDDFLVPLIYNAFSLNELVNKAHVDLEELLRLDRIAFADVLGVGSSIVRLVNEARIPFFELVSCVIQNKFTSLFRNPDLYIRLIKEEIVTFEHLRDQDFAFSYHEMDILSKDPYSEESKIILNLPLAGNKYSK